MLRRSNILACVRTVLRQSRVSHGSWVGTDVCLGVRLRITAYFNNQTMQAAFSSKSSLKLKDDPVAAVKKVLGTFQGTSCLKKAQFDNAGLVAIVDGILEILGTLHPRFKLKRTLGPLRVPFRPYFRNTLCKVPSCWLLCSHSVRNSVTNPHNYDSCYKYHRRPFSIFWPRKVRPLLWKTWLSWGAFPLNCGTCGPSRTPFRNSVGTRTARLSS